ncbi:MAG: BlaI/MecI/CopY family transcriptional regulator [Planctomycetaceae bacterium]|nr:BlaI/MecI/CopY family transcriptional regulator [Planctomycetaceae bacterium]
MAVILQEGMILNALNRNELEVLRILWDEAPRKPAEIQCEFGWPIDNGTLRSVLVGMTDANLLKRERVGRAFFYRPRVRKEAQLRQIARRLADFFAGGSTGQLLMRLAEAEKLSPEQLKRLREIADASEE